MTGEGAVVLMDGWKDPALCKKKQIANSNWQMAISQTGEGSDSGYLLIAIC
jgi:hypothetical protein